MSACAKHSGCVRYAEPTDLGAECCPARDGTYLPCCPLVCAFNGVSCLPVGRTDVIAVRTCCTRPRERCSRNDLATWDAGTEDR